MGTTSNNSWPYPESSDFVADGATAIENLADAIDADFDTGVLKVNSANNRVGINDASPSYALDVTGDINATGDIRIGGTEIGKWTSFTPSFTSLTVGNGTLTAEYCQVNEIVFWRLELIFGSTTSISGIVYVDYPIQADGSYLGSIGGSVFYEDDDTSGDFFGSLFRSTTSRARLIVYNVVGTFVSQASSNTNVPFTWTTGDRLLIEDFYRPA